MKMLMTILLLASVSESKIIPGNGTFMFNGIFSVVTEDHVNIQSGFMMIEAMKFAIDVVNRQNALNGYKMGINKIFDVKSSIDVRNATLDTFTQRIPFLIGPYSSATSYIASILSATFGQVVTVSYSASYSGFDYGNHEEEKMLRTVPSDAYRTQALLDLLLKLEWNYVSVISSYGYDGERDARDFIIRLSTIGACLSEQIDLPNSPSEYQYETTIDSLTTDQEKLKGVVFFTNKIDSKNLFDILTKFKLYNHFVIICVYGCTNYIEIIEGNEEVLNGTISIDLHNEEIPGFEEYIENLTPSKTSEEYFLSTWEYVFNCSLFDRKTKKQRCTGKEKFSRGVGYYPNTPVRAVMDCVYAIADALSEYLQFVCSDVKGWMKGKKMCILDASEGEMYTYYVYQILMGFSYVDGTLEDFNVPYNRTYETVKYDIHQLIELKGKYVNKFQGRWSIKTPQLDDFPKDVLAKSTVNFTTINTWRQENNIISPKIICSNPCPTGYQRINDRNSFKEKCCWVCTKCPFNSISINGTCKRCKYTECVDLERNMCVNLPKIRMSINGAQPDPAYISFTLLITFGYIILLLITGLFVFYKNHRIIKSAGRDLCFLILLGIAILFAYPITYMVYPTMLSCVFRGLLPGVAFLLIYASILLREIRIYRILVQAKKLYHPILVSATSQIFIVFAIICVQGLCVSIWFTEKTPGVEYSVSKNHDYIRIQCTGDSSKMAMFINLTLSFVFMVSCTILAFKCRHFPMNYNEARFMGITMYVTCVIWAVFLPTCYLTHGKGNFVREYLICALCIIIGYVTLLGIFGQKVKLLMHPRLSDNDLTNPKTWSLSHLDDLHQGVYNPTLPMQMREISSPQVTL